MIYEIFKAAFDNSHSPWIAYAGAVLFSAYAIYILGWVCGWVYCQSYAFVFEGRKEAPNPMLKWADFWLGDVDFDKKTLNGWYRSSEIGKSGYWVYRKFVDGNEVDHQDRKPNSLRVAPGRYVLFSGWDKDMFLLMSPAWLVVLFLVVDTFPVFAACIAIYYGMLLAVRKAIKLVAELENHINNKELHK